MLAEGNIIEAREVSTLARPRDFLFLDRTTIDRMVDQLRGVGDHGPDLADPYADKADWLLDEAALLNVLFSVRPGKICEPATPTGHLVRETCTATAMTVPAGVLAPGPGLESVRLWVSDPDATRCGDHAGSFLFLSETRFDEQSTSYVRPGVSALRFLVNALAGRHPLNGPEPDDCTDLRHPLATLTALGAVRGETMRIETFYRIRYMSGEQSYLDRGALCPAHGILGHPIFIAAV